jgi:hypothetical protein
MRGKKMTWTSEKLTNFPCFHSNKKYFFIYSCLTTLLVLEVQDMTKRGKALCIILAVTSMK